MPTNQISAISSLIVNTSEYGIGGVSPFSVGAVGLPRVLVCIEGGGEIEQGYATYAIGKGDVLFLPAVMGPCTLWPRGAVNLLEIALPE
jgi:mannose-6-phosphate isomerase